MSIISVIKLITKNCVYSCVRNSHRVDKLVQIMFISSDHQILLFPGRKTTTCAIDESPHRRRESMNAGTTISHKNARNIPWQQSWKIWNTKSKAKKSYLFSSCDHVSIIICFPCVLCATFEFVLVLARDWIKIKFVFAWMAISLVSDNKTIDKNKT